MVKVKTIEEFNSIQKSEFGFIIVYKNNSKVMHKTNCIEINSEKFFETLDSTNNVEYHWFSTVSLTEKAFSDYTTCQICKSY